MFFHEHGERMVAAGVRRMGLLGTAFTMERTLGTLRCQWWKSRVNPPYRDAVN
jgi:hypothetical protein